MDRNISVSGFTSQLPISLASADKPIVALKTTGRFEIQNGYLWLIDDLSSGKHAWQNIAFERNLFNREDGSIRMPKPFIVNNGIQEQIGDILLISFINGDIHTPIVEGSLDFLAIKHKEVDLQYNLDNFNDIDKEVTLIDNKYIRLFSKNDGRGEITYKLEAKDKGTGNVNIELIGTKGNGKININTNGIAGFNQKDRDGNTIQSLVFDNTEDAEKITVTDKAGNKIELSRNGLKIAGQSINEITKKSENKFENSIFGETLKQKLEELINAILTLTVPTPAGPSGIPNNASVFSSIKNNLSEILTK